MFFEIFLKKFLLQLCLCNKAFSLNYTFRNISLDQQKDYESFYFSFHDNIILYYLCT